MIQASKLDENNNDNNFNNINNFNNTLSKSMIKKTSDNPTQDYFEMSASDSVFENSLNDKNDEFIFTNLNVVSMNSNPVNPSPN